jgi:D-alanine-D-alanine ligase
MKKLCIIYGGRSCEHKDSIESFENLYDVIREQSLLTYKLEKVIYIDLSDKAYLHDVDFTLNPSAYRKKEESLNLFDILIMLKEMDYFLFSTLFSQNGEDGRMQGVAKLIGIATNLGDPLPSSICLSKYHLNQYLQGMRLEIHVPVTFRIDNKFAFDQAVQNITQPVVVIKPNALGSSILTEKFNIKTEIYSAWETIKRILKHDTYALLQEYIDGEEYTCGVMEENGEPALVAIGKVNTSRRFFGFPEKNDASLNFKEIIRMPYSPVFTTLSKAALDLFRDLNLTNIARFDFIIQNEKVFFLECNQFPSLHRFSFFMMMLKEKGITIADAMEVIINNESQRKQINPVFDGYDEFS